MKKILISMAISAGLTTGLFASANSNAGCGLGSVIINKQGSIWNLFQVTTNGTSGTQTFGITSGTSGCERGVGFLDSRTQEFVASNMDAISQEIARGDGEHLDTLIELLDISDKDGFKVALQENYNKLYKNKDVQSADVLDGVASL
ncbi:DUF3015 domain-containing protein [Helicobacter muridarum]|uniref:DUF3015 domain-containing protein n=1 Tax=Helicobacter muridarum TaxID=216 RepID=A0A099TYB6_9HELI|nr:DUF3015 family protein [Helicobacter muridarum]TLE01668.1 DUF3015 domain-containing protein [Helicobacter muridarum]STQ86293.1 Protein of uncharacterised function (DUF3015) [Helicobacter muridarum]